MQNGDHRVLGRRVLGIVGAKGVLCNGIMGIFEDASFAASIAVSSAMTHDHRREGARQAKRWVEQSQQR